MKGLDRVKAFYDSTLLPALKEEFPTSWDSIFISKKGRGSECYGFDDEISKDHDYNHNVQIVLTEEQDRAFGFKLMRFYHQFEEKGTKSIFREKRDGIFSLPEFLEQLIGSSTVPTTPFEYLKIPEHALYEAQNGAILQEGDGVVLSAMKAIDHVPLDVYRQRLAAHLTLAYQAGVYNALRMLKRGDEEAFQLCINLYIEHISCSLFAINQKNAPYYKWRFRALHELPLGRNVVALLSSLLLNKESDKISLITSINNELLALLCSQSFTTNNPGTLALAALQVREKIEDKRVRSLHIMEY